MAKHSSHILDMARKGAEHKHQELKAEIAELLKNFPHLAGGKTTVVSPAAAAAPKAEGAVIVESAPRKRKMSAKARKAISEAQKKRWAKQKAAEKK